MLDRLLEKRREGGFTLIELLIVIIILAILAAIVVFAVGSTTKNATVAACDANAKSVETALEAYKAQWGTYPAALSDLTTSTVANGDTTGPWLRQIPTAAVANNSYSVGETALGNVEIYYSSDGALASGDYDAAATDPCANA